MDNNTQQPPATPPQETPQVTPSVATTTPLPSPSTPSPEHKSRFKLLFAILIVLGIIFLGGTYYMVTTQKSASQTPIVNKTVETQTEMHKLDEELQSTDDKSIESDFTEVDQELENL